MIILASNSWMKKTILKKAGFKFKSIDADIDEQLLQKKMHKANHSEVCVALAQAKAEKIAEKFPNDFIIAADSFGVLEGGKRLSKPKNNLESINLSMKQSGKTTICYTGIAIIYKKKIFTGHTVTKVKYCNFDRRTIEHLTSGQDSSIRNGGLGFFIDAPGFTLVSEFIGSYTGAMGLPMEIVRNVMKDFKYKV